MKIVDERKQKTNFFKEVGISHVFYVKNEDVYGYDPYMRISAIRDIDDDWYNAVNLQDGDLTFLNDNEPVILCSATLKIY